VLRHATNSFALARPADRGGNLPYYYDEATEYNPPYP